MDGYDPQISHDRFIANLTHMFPMIDVDGFLQFTGIPWTEKHKTPWA